MAPGKSRPAKSSAKTPVRTARWLAAGAGLAAIAVVGLLAGYSASSRDAGAQADAGLCPNFDVDPNTGKMRDRGLIRCDMAAAQNGRIDLIRKGFNPH
jgi:hypothetical protein